MAKERKVTVIPPVPIFINRVAIYSRVSTSSTEQLNSLINQISYLTRLISGKLNWRLVDIYFDVQSGGSTKNRSEFQRMIADCEAKKIDIIVTKSVSRFGRNTIDTLNTINKLRKWNVDVYFENEELHTFDSQSELIISILETVAQQENVERSQNIRWGMCRKIESGESQLLRRKCYGYTLDEDNKLQISESEAVVVRLIFDLYMQGFSIIGIMRELERKSIKSPTGKDSWSKRTIELLLSNEKYTGEVIVFKTYNDGFIDTKRRINMGEKTRYIASDCNPVIITKEQFEEVQNEKLRRSNVVKSKDGNQRKSTKYSSKQKQDDSSTKQ